DYANEAEANRVVQEVRGEVWSMPDMRLVEDDRIPAPALDDDALPAGWAEWITKEAAAQACPRDYVAASLIAAASAWIGNSRHICATATWIEPPHIWLTLIGAPSMGKTPGQKTAIEACRAIERDAEADWQAEIAEHAGRAEAARAIEEQWRVDVRKATKDGTPAPARPAGAEDTARTTAAASCGDGRDDGGVAAPIGPPTTWAPLHAGRTVRLVRQP